MFVGLSTWLGEASPEGQTDAFPDWPRHSIQATAAQSPAGPLSGSGKLRVSGESAGRAEGRTGCQHPPLSVKGSPDGRQYPSHGPLWSWGVAATGRQSGC